MKSVNLLYLVGSGTYIFIGFAHLLAHLARPVEFTRTKLYRDMSSYKIEFLGSHSLLKFHEGFSLAMGLLFITFGFLAILTREAALVSGKKTVILFHIFAGIGYLLIMLFYAHPGAVALCAVAILSYVSALILSLNYGKIQSDKGNVA